MFLAAHSHTDIVTTVFAGIYNEEHKYREAISARLWGLAGFQDCRIKLQS